MAQKGGGVSCASSDAKCAGVSLPAYATEYARNVGHDRALLRANGRERESGAGMGTGKGTRQNQGGKRGYRQENRTGKNTNHTNMTMTKIQVRDLDEVVAENEDDVRGAVCNTITELLLTSSLGSEQLKEICNRMKRE